MQIKVIYSLIDNMVNFKDKNMPAVIDKAPRFHWCHGCISANTKFDE
ncbi:hypothetical protein DMI70_23190 [Escherichia coli]|nr:hypothetical protein [Escherichia coli]